MTLLYYDKIFLEHDTGNHPENAGRLRAVVERLEKNQVLGKCTQPVWQPASLQQLCHVHSADHIEAIKRFAERGGGQIEQDTVVSAKSFAAASKAAGAACDAVSRVIAGEDRNALCLVRPPGHHALHSHPMGFCLFNNIAVAASAAIEECGLERVMIVDWDVHHGNGTQAIFWETPNVGFLSMHRYPFYPGSGAADETGAGAGKGYTVNLPIRFGTSRKEQIERFRTATEDFADKLKPELILISAGFDSHVNDPIGSLELESEDFTTLTEIVLGIARTHTAGRVVSLLEGGYNPAALAECVEYHLRALLDSGDEG
jgi:acetoin utilization deacetylase AcuC-like enzyme